MRRFQILICSFIIVCTFTGCTQNNNHLFNSTKASDAASKANDAFPIVSTSTPSPIINEGSDKLSNQVQSKEQNGTSPSPFTSSNEQESTSAIQSSSSGNESFYGEWIVQKVLPNDGVSTYGKEDLEAIIGKHLVYSSTYVGFDNKVQIEKPNYKVKTVSEKEFGRRSFKELGINDQTVKEVVVLDQSNKQWFPAEKRMIGMAFIIKDRDTLIAGRNADDFELVRVKPPSVLKQDKQTASVVQKQTSSPPTDGVKNQTYTFTTESYSQDNITVQYPQIRGLGDDSKENTINNLIKNDVLSSQVEEPIKLYQKDTNKNVLNLDLKCQVTMSTSDLLSVVYTGYSSIVGAAHPNNEIYSITIDLKNMTKLKLSDFTTIDNKLTQSIKQSTA